MRTCTNAYLSIVYRERERESTATASVSAGGLAAAPHAGSAARSGEILKSQCPSTYQ
jgi:hypothetical protein